MMNNQSDAAAHPIDCAYPDHSYDMLARDLGEERALLARLPCAERMRELAWYHAHFNTPDDLSPCPANSTAASIAAEQRCRTTSEHTSAHGY